MGRTAYAKRDLRDAERWFNQSLELCLHAQFGSTVRVMALLPLSALIQPPFKTPENAEQIMKTIRNAAFRLDPDHFQIFKKDDKTIMEHVRRHPERLFPFSYR